MFRRRVAGRIFADLLLYSRDFWPIARDRIGPYFLKTKSEIL